MNNYITLYGEEGSRKEAGRRLRASTPGKHYEPMLFLLILQ